MTYYPPPPQPPNDGRRAVNLSVAALVLVIAGVILVCVIGCVGAIALAPSDTDSSTDDPSSGYSTECVGCHG